MPSNRRRTLSAPMRRALVLFGRDYVNAAAEPGTFADVAHDGTRGVRPNTLEALERMGLVLRREDGCFVISKKGMKTSSDFVLSARARARRLIEHDRAPVMNVAASETAEGREERSKRIMLAMEYLERL